MKTDSDQGTQSLRDAAWVAQRLGVSRWCVYELVKRDALPHVRLGARVRFDESAIEAFIRAGGTCEQPDEVRPLPIARSR